MTRFRLTAIYVAFTAILLIITGFFFRQHVKHETELAERAAVEADLGATLGFLHIERQRPEWVYDRNDPEETYTVERLRRVYQLTDPAGNVLEESAVFQSASKDSSAPYVIRTRWIRDDQNRSYGLALGRSLVIGYRKADRIVGSYALICLPILALTSLFSWWLTGIAMRKSIT